MYQPIITFYSGKTCDHRGRSIFDILNYSDDQLEKYHDFIQWLFPLKVKSPINPYAPILNNDIITEFKLNTLLLNNLCKSCSRMLSFYGLCCSKNIFPSNKIVKNETFINKSKNWIKKSNHNHLRLTRILTCLNLLGLKECSASLYKCLIEITKEYPSCFSKETIQFWINTQ